MTHETLRDIKGPLSLRANINFFLILFIILILAAAAFALIYFLRKNKKMAPAVRVPAHQTAYEQLEALRSKGLIAHGRFKQFYTEISDIVRHYLENRFGLGAPEMTTEEFLFYVRDSGSLVSAHKVLLKEFLVACDLVKFARHTPSVLEAGSAMAAAMKLVDETKETEISVV